MSIHVLVSGGAGYIGSQTCKILAENGFIPITVDNLSTGHREAVKWGPLIEADISDKEKIKTVVRTFDIKAAIHFAAFSLVGESVRDPGKYFDNNIASANRFAEALVEAGVKAFVFSSTAAVYGNPESELISETHPTRPINPYGESKLGFEKVLRWTSEAHDFRYVALRYFNAAGADFDGEVGESHMCETHLIPLVCQAALGTGKALSVFGNDYDTRDGTAIRDYIHVVDLAAAHVEALKYLLAGGQSDTFNVGTGHGQTVMEIIEACQAVTGHSVPYSLQPRRQGDPQTLVADVSKIQAVFDWRPKHSDVQSIVATAFRWQKERPY
ncbi:UDP-glucose 4-epimerase GalE [Asticcacaulis sp. W401b]|uniref:UDP-glucose 4-epimerase GalE n=1 Tax=Asticcacaulis sp. W401b TaxID=3388666 RepID=UPI0039708447